MTKMSILKNSRFVKNITNHKTRYFTLSVIIMLILSSYLLISFTQFSPFNAQSSISYQTSWKKDFPDQSNIVFVGDINNDNLSEIVVLESLIDESGSQLQMLVILNSTGYEIKELNISAILGENVLSHLLVQVIDTNLDGISEIILVVPSTVLELMCISWIDQKILWANSYNLSISSAVVYRYAKIDLNSDHISDLILLLNGVLIAVDCKNGAIIWSRKVNVPNAPSTIYSTELLILNNDELIVINPCVISGFDLENGDSLWNFTTLPQEANTIYLDSETYDINNDGLDEIFFAIPYSNESVTPSEILVGCITVEHDNPRYLWKKLIPSSTFFGIEVFTVEGSVIGIAISTDEKIYVLDGNSGEIIWSKNLSFMSIAFDDVNEDGVTEIVGGRNTTLWCISARDGSILHEYFLNATALLSQISSKKVNAFKETYQLSAYWASIKINDVNNDGHKEIITTVAMAGSSSGSAAFVIIFNNNLEEVSKTYIDSYIEIKYVLYAFLDNSESLELLILARDTHTIPTPEYHLYLLKAAS